MSAVFGIAALFAVYVLIFQLPRKETIVRRSRYADGYNSSAKAVPQSNCPGCHGDEF